MSPYISERHGDGTHRSFPAGLVMLAIYAMPIAMLNTAAVAPLLLDAAPSPTA
jgi:hypothetical protein